VSVAGIGIGVPSKRTWLVLAAALLLVGGFTLARGGASAVLSLPLRANVPVTLAADRQSVAFGTALRYSGLLVTDARGRRLHSWLALGATIQTDEEKVEINSVV